MHVRRDGEQHLVALERVAAFDFVAGRVGRNAEEEIAQVQTAQHTLGERERASVLERGASADPGVATSLDARGMRQSAITRGLQRADCYRFDRWLMDSFH